WAFPWSRAPTSRPRWSRTARTASSGTSARRKRAGTASAGIGSRTPSFASPAFPPRGNRDMAHKKGQGSSRNGRDSPGQHRGIKIYGGERVVAGNILVRQVGTRVHPGRNVGMGRDFTIYAVVEGEVKYQKKADERTYVHVVPGKPRAEA